jgi:zinc ribbon protein
MAIRRRCRRRKKLITNVVISLLIGSRRLQHELARGKATFSPLVFPYTQGSAVSPIFRRSGTRTKLPPAGVLRRERRALLKYREERLRDLGGLLLEMFRRDRFREDLVRERCEELLEIDDNLAALDSLLGLSWSPPEPARCACGAPLPDEARFCPACGRSVTGAAHAEVEVVHEAEPAPELPAARAEAAES